MSFETLSQYKHIIWDWNGTLLNDVVVTHSVLNSQLKKADMEEVSIEVYREKQCFPIRDFYSVMGFNYETHPFESIANDFMKEYEERIDKEAKVFEDRPELLNKLKNNGTRHYLLSAAPHDHLVEIVTRHKLVHFFDKISGSDDNHASGKIERAKILMEDTDIDPKNCALVGDTDHDLEVGQALGIDVWLVSDGHQSRDRLSKIHGSLL